MKTKKEGGDGIENGVFKFCITNATFDANYNLYIVTLDSMKAGGGGVIGSHVFSWQLWSISRLN